jgi:hypothetical protein
MQVRSQRLSPTNAIAQKTNIKATQNAKQGSSPPSGKSTDYSQTMPAPSMTMTLPTTSGNTTVART